jgi:hypothetical protein
MHACAIADELGMRTVLVPRAGGVLSALGLAIADIRRDYVGPLFADVATLDAGPVDRRLGLAGRARPHDLKGFSAEPSSSRLAISGIRASPTSSPSTATRPPRSPRPSTARTCGGTATARTTSRWRSSTSGWSRPSSASSRT